MGRKIETHSESEESRDAMEDDIREEREQGKAGGPRPQPEGEPLRTHNRADQEASHVGIEHKPNGTM